MAFPDFNIPYILHVDASHKGLGCVLYQRQGDKLRVIGYGSRTLVGAEKKYHSSKLEFLALKWAITQQFKPYLGPFKKYVTVKIPIFDTPSPPCHRLLEPPPPLSPPK